MEIIPAIDIINGKCVRLEKGDYSKVKSYHEDPVEVARQFESAGLKRLHLVDLDGAKAKKIINYSILRQICTETSLHVDFGGGVKDPEQVVKVFDAGAKQVTGGSIAAKNRDLFLAWIENYGTEKIILGADVLDGKIMVSGWKESTSIDLFEFLEYYLDVGIRYVICTDIMKDGMMAGPSVELYREIITKYPDIKLIASGGIRSIEDLNELKREGLYGAIVGKAIHEQKIALNQLTQV